MPDVITDPNLEIASAFRRIAKSLTRTQMPLREYVQEAWPIVVPNRPIVPNWHIDLILEYLTAVDLGQITRLLINIQPRSLKSLLVSVFWPSWSWSERAWLKWIFSSYAASLSVKHSMDRRRIIESPWYQRSWGDAVHIEDDQNQKAEYQNTQGGMMVATSVGGSITGKGGDRIVIDDQMNPEKAESKVERESHIEHYQKTLSTRLDDKKRGAIVIIEQRTHRQDLSGTVLAEGNWTHVKIPAEAPAMTVVEFPLSHTQILRKQGDVLCAEREGPEQLAQQKKVMGTRAYEAQYLQEPSNEDSGYFKPEWWQSYRLLPIGEYIRHWSWDTAMKEGEENDYSAGILLAHGAPGTFVERVVHVRLAYPELKRRVLEEWAAHPAQGLLVEDTASGTALGQDIAKNTNIPILLVKPVGDKVFRASLCSPMVESRRVFLLADTDWVGDFKDELSVFPQGTHDDQVDAFSQGMNHFYLGAGKPFSALSGQGIDQLALTRPAWL